MSDDLEDMLNKSRELASVGDLDSFKDYISDFEKSNEYSESKHLAIYMSSFEKAKQEKQEIFFVHLIASVPNKYLQQHFVREVFLAAASLNMDHFIDAVSPYHNNDCPNAGPYYFLEEAVQNNHASCVEKLLKFSDQVAVHRALYLACEDDRREMIDILYDGCENVEAAISKFVISKKCLKEDLYLYQIWKAEKEKKELTNLIGNNFGEGSVKSRM